LHIPPNTSIFGHYWFSGTKLEKPKPNQLPTPMKKLLLRLLLPSVIIVSIFTIPAAVSSCRVSQTQMQVLKPADIMLPAHFQKFVLADRTRPGKGNGQQALNILEGLLTGEGLFQDKWASEDCLEGLRQVLTQTPRYTVTIAALDTALKGTGRQQVLPPLDWKTVARIIGTDTTTALVVLEAFDSNTDIAYDLVPTQQRQSDGTTITVNQHRARGRVNVITTWRIYDIKNKTISDQFTQTSNQVFEGQGQTQQDALGRLPARYEMSRRAGIVAGSQYGHRISPQFVWVGREYYRKAKGTPEMKAAGRLARFQNWQGASDIWNKLASNPDPKVARRASFNMALIAEQSGDLDLALQWANRSAQMGDRRAPRYVQTLQQRKWEQQRLEEQMKSKK
jgi:Family of unknown function (DUF6340)